MKKMSVLKLILLVISISLLIGSVCTAESHWGEYKSEHGHHSSSDRYDHNDHHYDHHNHNNCCNNCCDDDDDDCDCD
jgi:hypothetical protein